MELGARLDLLTEEMVELKRRQDELQRLDKLCGNSVLHKGIQM